MQPCREYSKSTTGDSWRATCTVGVLTVRISSLCLSSSRLDLNAGREAVRAKMHEVVCTGFDQRTPGTETFQA